MNLLEDKASIHILEAEDDLLPLEEIEAGLVEEGMDLKYVNYVGALVM